MFSALLNRSNQATITQLIVATVALKLLLVFLMPVTGDEAYFYLWGENPALTFYDHPPLTGWLLTLFQGLLGWTGSPILVLRLPALIITTLAGLLIYRHISRYYNPELALPVTAIYLLLPLNLIAGFIYTTDTLLLLFSLLALLAIDRAHKDEKLALYLVAGIWIGLAINTKYLSAIPATAIGLYLLVNLRKLGLKPVVFYVAAALPFILFNLYINSQTCWNNITFNLYSRNVASGAGWTNPATFIAQIFYLVIPLTVLYYSLIKQRQWGWLRQPLGQILLLALILFFALSIFKAVGLHWLLSITLLLIFPILMTDRVNLVWHGAAYAFIFSMMHIVALVGTIGYINYGLDKDIDYEADIYRSYYIATNSDVLQELADQYNYDALAANNYSLAAIIGFGIQKPVTVFGRGSPYARQDDFITDFRSLADKDILIIFSRNSDPSLERYFNDFFIEQPEFGGGQIHIALGKGFNYPLYLKEVLQPLARRFYKGLPFTEAGSCSFRERYLEMSDR